MRNFRDLEIWKKGIEISNKAYDIARELPSSERFNLSTQLTRAAVSIPSNIAEGSAKSSAKDFARYLEIALGSCYEMETQLLIIESNYDIEASNLIRELQTLEKMITSLHKKL